MKFFRLVLFLLIFSFTAAVSAADCDELFGQEGINDTELWYNLMGIVSKELKNKEHPFTGTEFDPDAIGKVHKKFREVYPIYGDVQSLRDNTNNGEEVSLEDYEKVKESIQKTLKDTLKKGSLDKKFAALETIRMMSTLESRLPMDEKETSTTDDLNPDQDDEDGEGEGDSGEQEKQKMPPPDVSDHYDPQMTDLAQGGGGQEFYHVVSFTYPDDRDPIPFLRQKIYDIISFQSFDASPGHRPVSRRQPTKKDQTAEMIIDPAGLQEWMIPKPYGLVPIPGSYADVKVVESTPGEYKAIFKKPKEDYRIPLANETGQVLPQGIDFGFYTDAPNIPIKEWPKNVQDFINSYSGSPSPTIVEDVTKFISKDGGFLYYSKGNKLNEAQLNEVKNKYDTLIASGKPKAVAATHAGAFNCDNAALIATQILRQYFKVPTRIAGGRTLGGWKTFENKKWFVSPSTSPLHAWIEVWDGSQWVAYDPTPIENNPDGESDNDNDLEPLDTDEENDQDSSDSDDSENTDSKTEESDESEDSKESSEEDDESKSEADESEEKDEKDEKEKSEEELNEMGSDVIDHLKNQESKNTNFNEFLEAFKIYITEKIIEQGKIKQISSELEPLIKHLNSRTDLGPELNDIIRGIKKLNRMFPRSCKKGFQDCLNEVKVMLSQGDDLVAFQSVTRLVSMLEYLAEMRPLKKHEAEQLGFLRKALAEFKRNSHPDAEAYERVKSVYESLPGDISREMMFDEYQIKELTPDDPGVLSLNQALKSGGAKHWLRLAAVKEFAEVYIHPFEETSWSIQMRMDRSPNPNDPEGLVIARSPLELNRMFLNPLPGEGIFDALFRGEQFAMGARETRMVEDPQSTTEHKKTVVFYDTSGSMSATDTSFGARSLMQGVVMAAFIDMALSERDFMGRHVHSIVLTGFDDEMHSILEIDLGNSDVTSSKINTIDKVKPHILSFINNGSTERGAGTSFLGQTPLEYHKIVQQAYNDINAQSAYAKLSRASAVIFSDGGGHVDENAVNESISQMPSDVTLQHNFIAISQTNDVLKRLAEGQNRDGGQSSYQHIGDEEYSVINQRMQDIINVEDAYYAGTSINKVRADVTPYITQAIAHSGAFISRWASNDVQEIDRSIGHTGKPGDIQDRALLSQLMSIQRALAPTLGSSEIDVPREYREPLVLGVASYYLKKAGRPAQKMTAQENNSLKILLRWGRN